MNEMMIVSAQQGGKYLPPPSPADYMFLASAANGMSPDLSGNKPGTGSGSGVTQGRQDGHLVIVSSGGYITYQYGLNLSPFRRGAKIDAMVYLDFETDVYPSQIHPTLIGFMSPSNSTNYWSFGVKYIRGVPYLCFYGYNGNPVQMNSEVPLSKGWHLLTFEMKNDGVHLSVDGKEVYFFAVDNAQLNAFAGAQGGVNSVPLTLFKYSTYTTQTKTAWVAIK
ncbi:MAG: hypothetical protein ACRC8W_06715 [Plesiomonas shigelloides]